MAITKDKKLSSFVVDGQTLSVRFVETQTVKEGVKCDIYSFVGDKSMDLAVVTVLPNHKTPMQRVLSGNKTIEGFISGEGTLSILGRDRKLKTYNFKDGKKKRLL